MFSVVDAFLRVLELGGSLGPDQAAFAARRRRQIAGEIAQVDHPVLATGLTEDGRGLVERLLRGFDTDGVVSAQEVGGHGAEDRRG